MWLVEKFVDWRRRRAGSWPNHLPEFRFKMASKRSTPTASGAKRQSADMRQHRALGSTISIVQHLVCLSSHCLHTFSVFLRQNYDNWIRFCHLSSVIVFYFSFMLIVEIFWLYFSFLYFWRVRFWIFWRCSYRVFKVCFSSWHFVLEGLNLYFFE